VKVIESQAEDTAGDQARAESLAALNGQVLDAEPVEGAQAGGVSGGGVIDPSQEARELIRFAATLFFPLYPSLERVYTETRQEQLAQVSAPLMAKYNLSLGAMFERWGAEINFALVAVPLVGETVKAVKADNQARELRQREEQEAKERGDNANQ
jgi:hypothetical protein